MITQQFYSHSMLDLRDLIIHRIAQLRQFPNTHSKLQDYFSPAATIQCEFQLNRAIMKQLTMLRKAEKERVEKEALLLDEMKHLRFINAKVIEEVQREIMQVYYASLDIFTFYDPSTRILCHIDSSLSDKLRQLYLWFFEKHQPKFSKGDLFEVLSHHITQSTPFILVGWVCEWSRGHFVEEIQNFVGKEFSRHEEEMKRINYSRGNSNPPVKERYTNLFSNSTSLAKTQDNILMLTNKESFYGLITEELTRYYKALPLDVDLGFIKTLRKLHSKGNEFQKEQNLQKAAEILIDSKNKHIKELMEKYDEQYRQKYPNILIKNISQPNIKKKQSPSVSPNKQPKCQLKKPFSFKKFFDRVKSQSQQDSTVNTYSQKRNSLLLCSKNQISFQSSKEIMKKLHRQKVRKQFQLPEIVPNNRMVCNNSSNPTSTSKNKQASFFGPVNRSMISSYQKANKNAILQPKCYDFKPSSKDRIKQKINTNCLRLSQKSRMQIEDNPETKRDLQDMKINRKLMLQLLREKNKHAFLDQ